MLKVGVQLEFKKNPKIISIEVYLQISDPKMKSKTLCVALLAFCLMPCYVEAGIFSTFIGGKSLIFFYLSEFKYVFSSVNLNSELDKYTNHVESLKNLTTI